MVQDLKQTVLQAVEEIIMDPKKQIDTRIEIKPNGFTTIVYLRLPEQESPLILLEKNATQRKNGSSAPVVVDPGTGFLSYRYVIPHIFYKRWGIEKTLRMVLSDQDEKKGIRMDWSKLRGNRTIPEDVDDFRYGRSARLRLLLERWPALLSAQVFPGGLYEKNSAIAPERLGSIARVLLVRSGIANRFYSFHMLPKPNFFEIERAAEIHTPLSIAQLNSFEKELMRQAEEDRHLLNIMLSPEIPLSSLFCEKPITNN
jgi:hypothetical protein